MGKNPKQETAVAAIQRLSSQIEQGVRLCLERRLQMPALMLLYSGIDIMSWLNAPEHAKEVNRIHFAAWVEKYMLSSGRIDCSAVDLYAARCGVLHTLTPSSNLSRSGKAKELLYSWGSADTESAHGWLKFLGWEKTHVFVHIDTLFDVFSEGVERFSRDVARSARRGKLVRERARNAFTEMKTRDTLKNSDS